VTISFKLTTLQDVSDTIKQHLSSLPSIIDSFLEDHIVTSHHYKIFLGAEDAGFTSIHQGSLITQFVLKPAFKHYGQSIYSQVKKLEEVQAAFVPTCDECFLSHALDDYRTLAKQAYFFAASPSALPEPMPTTFRLQQADKSDLERIKAGSGDFFADLEGHIRRQELFLTLEGDTCVGFGLLDKSELLTDVASIGMFVIEQFRKQGVGTATLRLLIAECQRQNLRAVAGCWYYNHLSKKTLECAGMFSQTRLLKVEY
jgi:RimJ/RimL family protein N-acetyltransferase